MNIKRIVLIHALGLAASAAVLAPEHITPPPPKLKKQSNFADQRYQDKVRKMKHKTRRR